MLFVRALLSVLIKDCLDKVWTITRRSALQRNRALLHGTFHSDQFLVAIRALVFDPTTAVTSLPELVEALLCNWGENMVEPFANVLEGPARIEARAERFRRLRAAAMGSRGSVEGTPMWTLSVTISSAGLHLLQWRRSRIGRAHGQKMLDLARRLGLNLTLRGFQIQPGVGTFENYLDWET